MAHTSPAVNLVWALLAVMLGTFLVYHLWSFDRFRCLRWNHGPYAGAFKRIMTYAYLLSVPLIIVYAVGFAIIKYTYGFAIIPGLGIVPTPYQEWSQTARNAIFPLYLSFSFAWGLELLTHLEELCFWLFLVNASALQQDWFQSLYFKTWAVGSCVAVVAMPMITILTRGDVYKCEAYTFLAGGLASVSLTIWFLPVLWTFPAFLDSLKDHEVDSNTLVRLMRFHELNCIRVVFRFLFTVPFIILGVDGVRPHQHINDKMFPTDFLAIVAGIGCVVSSGITLVIFFPRSTEVELARADQRRAHRHRPSWWARTRSTMPSQTRRSGSHSRTPSPDANASSYLDIVPSKIDREALHVGTLGVVDVGVGNEDHGQGLPAYDVVVRQLPHPPQTQTVLPEHEHEPDQKRQDDVGSIALKPNRLNKTGDVELGAVLSVSEVDLMRARTVRESHKRVSSLVYHWRSPIEIGRPVARWQRRV